MPLSLFSHSLSFTGGMGTSSLEQEAKKKVPGSISKNNFFIFGFDVINLSDANLSTGNLKDLLNGGLKRTKK
jgi:hypothetical protein